MADQILVPLDGSPESERALDTALPLARTGDNPLLLLWAWEGWERVAELGIAAAEDLTQAIEQRERADREVYLDALARRRCEPAGVAWQRVIPVGDPATTIVETAEAADVRYTVMATHGRSGFKRWRLGSVADRVLRTTSHTTVLIPPGEEREVRDRIRRILVPLDGSP